VIESAEAVMAFHRAFDASFEVGEAPSLGTKTISAPKLLA
jgi:hypothetical protein